MDFYKVITTRRSIRSFSDKRIPADVLMRVLDAARIAPSGSNRQPWQFILVSDPELKQSLVSACHNQRFIAAAPLVIAACGYDIEFDRGDWMGRYSSVVDVTIAMDHLILAARAEGLGTCWIGSFSDEQVKAILRVPEDWHVVALTPLGYPQGEAFAETTGRKPLEEMIHYDTWRE
jgi:nitroreductase